jgi:hypothetical protein
LHFPPEFRFSIQALGALSEPSKKTWGEFGGSRKQAEEALHAKAEQRFLHFWGIFFRLSLHPAESVACKGMQASQAGAPCGAGWQRRIRY